MDMKNLRVILLVSIFVGAIVCGLINVVSLATSIVLLGGGLLGLASLAWGRMNV